MQNTNFNSLVSATPAFHFDDIRLLVKMELEKVNELILSNLFSDVDLIQQICRYIINSGGKRLRPSLTLLCAKAFGYQGEAHIILATIVELIHTATLLHDDVIDNSSLRRGGKTANFIWGNQTSILVGDFLYSRALQLVLKVENTEVMRLLADTTNTIAEGEVLQLIHRKDLDTSEEYYLKIIHSKTAVLFGAASEFGAIIAKRSVSEQKAMYHYGLHLGMAFQMVDDWLDYSASSKVIGKNIGDDLAEGKLTLPLIYAMHHGTKEESDLIKETITKGREGNLDAVIRIINTAETYDYVSSSAQKQIDLAKGFLPNTINKDYREALEGLAQLAVDRKF